MESRPFLIMNRTTAIALASMGSQLTRNVGARELQSPCDSGLSLRQTRRPMVIARPIPIILLECSEIFLGGDGVDLLAKRHALVHRDSASRLAADRVDHDDRRSGS